MKKQKNKAFTLVELIVVITILAILGTIAFISLQGYSKTARDSKRISDIDNIKTSLALYNTKTGRYPEPDNGTNVVYSGTTVWTQGIVGEGVTRNLKELGTTPLDPLLIKEYAYSLLNTKNEYEIGCILEGEPLAYNTELLSKTNALSQTYNTLVRGNYNGQVAKASSGTTVYIFAIPSIIGSDLSNPSIIEILKNKSLTFNGYQNIPANYGGNNIVMTGSFEFGGNSFNPLIYSGSLDLLSSSGTVLKIFGDNLQTLYSGTILGTNSNYKQIIGMNTSNSDELTQIVGPIVNNHLGGKVIITSNTPIVCSLNTTEVNNLNTFFSGKGYNGDETYWCNLTSISVTRQGLSGNLLTEIGKLINLTTLNLSQNNITSLPESLGNLTKLISLDISINQLTNLPISLNRLTNLTTINLYSNQLTSIPNSIGNLTKLTSLNFAGNQLTSIPEFIGNLSNLTFINFNTNLLTKLPDSLINLQNLVNLYIDNNTSLGSLQYDYYTDGSTIKTLSNITPTGKTITINCIGTKIVITN